MMILEILLLSLALANGARIPRVIGGSEATPHEYPYQGSLFIEHSGAKSFPCSASIINHNWILTAARCVDRIDTSNLWFAAGIHRLIGKFDRYKIFSIHLYPRNSYNPSDRTNVESDIALLMVEGSINFNEHVQPISLPLTDLKDYNVSANFAGWGCKSAHGGYPDTLQKKKLHLISNEKCQKIWSAVEDNLICISEEAGAGSCGADAGAPLVVDGVQVGIASYGCALGAPVIFTKVFSYINWINDTINKNSLITFSI